MGDAGCNPCLWLWPQGDVGLSGDLGSFPPLQLLARVGKGRCHVSECLVALTWEVVGVWTLVRGQFFDY